ncbi:MAG: hypothetical protein SAJ37_14690 [Oscillatoria sp. PMC 1068.18]|nr:hypothetical protein [Oscillatoria sp. PMC 1076.18]MEC4989976.1 hypothetical protein [Oscillatoria sp. PMC 1068.18]
MEARNLSQNPQNQLNNFQKNKEQKSYNFEEWAKAVRPQLLAALRKKSVSS